MSRITAKLLKQKGLEAYSKAEGTDAEKLIEAIAVMLVTKAKNQKKEPQLKVSPQLVHQKLSEVPGLDVSTYTKNSFGRLGKLMAGITPAVTEEDIDKIVVWLKADGLTWWQELGKIPTWNNVIKNFEWWLTTARSFVTPKNESVIR